MRDNCPPAVEIILCTLGTRGDFLPFLEIAAALRARGYDVTLLSNANWREAAEARGVSFVAVADKDISQSDRDDRQFFQTATLPTFRRTFDYIVERVARGRKPLLVYRANMVGVQAASHRLGLAGVKIFLQPSGIRSHLAPPWPMSLFTEGRLGVIGRKVIVPTLYNFVEATGPFRRPIRSFRRSVGLPPRISWRQCDPSDAASLLLCPPWFALPQPDWPVRLRATGFVLPAVVPLEPRLHAFIRRNGPPLVFTPGTGVTDTAGFFARAVTTLKKTGYPGVFLSRHVPNEYRQDQRILCRDYADLGTLLPLSRVIFHHGGIGTVAQAVAAGLPQIILPGRFDQPDNAMRIARLGLGAAILSSEFGGEAWAELLEQTLASQHIALQLQTARRLNAAEDGLANAVGAIEAVAGTHSDGHSVANRERAFVAA